MVTYVMCISQLNFLKRPPGGKTDRLHWAGLSWRDRNESSPQEDNHKSALPLLLSRVGTNQVSSKLHISDCERDPPTQLCVLPAQGKRKPTFTEHGHVLGIVGGIASHSLWSFS